MQPQGGDIFTAKEGETNKVQKVGVPYFSEVYRRKAMFSAFRGLGINFIALKIIPNPAMNSLNNPKSFRYTLIIQKQTVTFSKLLKGNKNAAKANLITINYFQFAEANCNG